MKHLKLSHFDATVTPIFNSLLESFPAPRQLDARVAGFKAFVHPIEDEYFFADIVRWLATQRYITFAQEDCCTFSEALLTEKGLQFGASLAESSAS